jgi:hypothetical protein
MLDLFHNFQMDVAGMATWVRIWLVWLAFINSASIFFVFTRPETRWVLVAWIAAVAGVMSLYYLQGFTRLLGLGHIIAWTPLLWYLYRRRGEIFLTHTSGVYLHLLFFSNAISLLFDYTDLVRYFLGQGY